MTAKELALTPRTESAIYTPPQLLQLAIEKGAGIEQFDIPGGHLVYLAAVCSMYAHKLSGGRDSEDLCPQAGAS